jgi:hypothetical protein
MVSTISISFPKAPLSAKSKELGGYAEVGQFWTPITPENGSFLHAGRQVYGYIHKNRQEHVLFLNPLLCRKPLQLIVRNILVKRGLLGQSAYSDETSH